MTRRVLASMRRVYAPGALDLDVVNAWGVAYVARAWHRRQAMMSRR